MSDEIDLGPHSIAYEPETGFVIMRHVGVIDEVFAARISERMSHFQKPGEPSFVLADNTQATGITPEGRKVFGRSKSSQQTSYIAMYGGSFAYRVIANLVMKAISISSKSTQGKMVANEAEAREWLTEQRKRVLGR